MNFKYYFYSVIVMVSIVNGQSNQTSTNNVNNNSNSSTTGKTPLTSSSHNDTSLINSTVHDATHLSREHVTSKPKTIPLNDIKPAVDKVKTLSMPPLKNEHTSKNNKSNVIENTTVKTNVIATAKNTSVKAVTTQTPRKPTKTVHDDVDPNNSDIIKNSDPPLSKMSSMDPTVNNRKLNRANYVVPIVGVILSVPLVSFLISVLYKRTKDWWLHRNYRRMDYLIEGLYNS